MTGAPFSPSIEGRSGSTRRCRACAADLPATAEFFYRAGAYLDWVCKPCKVTRSTERKRIVHDRPGERQLTCGFCRRSFVSSIKAAAYCSRQCGSHLRGAYQINQRFNARPDRVCEHCGNPVSAKLATRARFCSERCNTAAHQWWRKSAERTGATRAETRRITRRQLGDRDGWTCGICSEPVDRRLRYPALASASVDHIFPVAHGGTHESTNLQIAHLGCNLAKRDRLPEGISA